MSQRSTLVVTPDAEPQAEDMLVLEREVEALIPMHRSTRYRKVLAGDFPPPIWISKGRRAWRLSSLRAWIAQREQNPIRPRTYFGRQATANAQPPTPAHVSNQLATSRRTAAKAVTK